MAAPRSFETAGITRERMGAGVDRCCETFSCGGCECAKCCSPKYICTHFWYNLVWWGFVGLIVGLSFVFKNHLGNILVVTLGGPIFICPVAGMLNIPWDGTGVWYTVGACIAWGPLVPFGMGMNDMAKWTQENRYDRSILPSELKNSPAYSYKFAPGVEFHWGYRYQFDFQVQPGGSVPYWDRLYLVPISDPGQWNRPLTPTWLAKRYSGYSIRNPDPNLSPPIENVFDFGRMKGYGCLPKDGEDYTVFWEGAFQAAESLNLTLPQTYTDTKIVVEIDPYDSWDLGKSWGLLLGGIIPVGVIWLLCMFATCYMGAQDRSSRSDGCCGS